jgi:predicted dehydrogenase
MTTQTIGIIFNGATGRIGSTQHLANALLPIIKEGGLVLGDRRLIPKLLLVGRNGDRLAAIARAHDVAAWTTDLDLALASREHAVFFDAAATSQRVAVLEKAIAAGKHVYAEKPLAPTTAQATALLRQALARGCKHGVVEDKIHLPGLQKLAGLLHAGELGRVVSFRLEFGWWVFDGSEQPCQRPSWNYRPGGGGLIRLASLILLKNQQFSVCRSLSYPCLETWGGRLCGIRLGVRHTGLERRKARPQALPALSPCRSRLRGRRRRNLMGVAAMPLR